MISSAIATFVIWASAVWNGSQPNHLVADDLPANIVADLRHYGVYISGNEVPVEIS